MEKQGYVYILTNESNTALYVGVTDDIEERMRLYKSGKIEGYCKRNKCAKLVWFQLGDSFPDAVYKRSELRASPRARVNNVISKTNPDWEDLAEKWK